MAQRFQPTVSTESSALVSTVLTLVVGSATLLAVLILVGFLSVGRASTLVTSLPLAAVMFALLDMVASCGWGVATSVAILSRRTRTHATLTSIRVVASPTAVLIALFGLQVHGPMALFAGVAVGGLVSVLGTWIIVLPYLQPVFDSRIAREVLGGGGWLRSLANSVEMFHRLVERWALASFVGVRATGLLSHAQIYPNMLMMSVRPALQSAWPNLCEEARVSEPSFPRSRHLVHLIGLGIIVAALVMALVGQEMISLLTHGRFIEAAPYAAILTAVAGLRLAGRPQHAVVVANGICRRRRVGQWTCALAGLLVLAFVPECRLGGAVAALIGYALAFLTLLHYLSRRIRPAPILDLPVVGGFVTTVLAVFWVATFQPSLSLRLGLAILVCVIGALVALIIFRRSGLPQMLASRRRLPSVIGH